MGTMSVEKVVEKIYQLQDRRSALVDQANEIKAVEDKLRNWLLSALENNGLTKMGVDCAVGKVTVFSKTTTKASVADWDEVLGYIKQNDAYDLLTHHISSKAVKELLDNDVHVPGINLFNELTLGLQKR